jgi:peptide-methionine (R)-S-oxide reductase
MRLGFLGLIASAHSLALRSGIRSTRARSALFRMSSNKASLPTSDEGWRTVLSPDQFRILRQKGTEPPGFSESRPGELEYELKKSEGTKYPESGAYECAACGSPLYYARSKFSSGCGWPAYYGGIPGAIKEIPDRDGRPRAVRRAPRRTSATEPCISRVCRIRAARSRRVDARAARPRPVPPARGAGRRVEIVCNNCGSHLGHTFKGEGFPTPTDERHCVNGVCLKYNAAGDQPEDVKQVPAALRPREMPK